MKQPKKEYPSRSVVHWFFGNYCTRKCLDNDDRLFRCSEKLEKFAQEHPAKIRHREFLGLMQNTLNICELAPEERTRAISYQEFMKKQPVCPLCKKLGCR